MTGLKTNEMPGTRAVLRQCRVSAYKVRLVLDLIRGKDIQSAAEILRFSDVASAEVVAKLLASAVANAEHNDGLDPSELYVSACYADEGATLKRCRPRASGRATRIRKRTCHVTIIVSRLPEERLRRLRARQAAEQAAVRSRRAAGGRRTRRAAGADGAGRTESVPPASGAQEDSPEVQPVEEAGSSPTSVAAEEREPVEAPGQEPDVAPEGGAQDSEGPADAAGTSSGEESRE